MDDGMIKKQRGRTRDVGLRDFDVAVQGVVEAQMCTGCGLCTQLDPRWRMARVGGFWRPVLDPERGEDGHAGEYSGRDDALKDFRRACPGLRVHAGAGDAGALRHPLLGQYHGLWAAHAIDDEVRRKGSSGGVLTALNRFLIDTGRASRVISAGKEPDAPARSVALTLTTKEEALAAAGSRYAPVSVLASPDLLAPGTTVTCKPCEASALRALHNQQDAEPPIILSFFCAGTPDQRATDNLVTKLGMPDDEPVADLWYRGRGWPGEFTAVGQRGTVVSMKYESAWGGNLGPTVQWRCRVCPDGVGESADISAGDVWEADEKGYPLFAETKGRSVLIARTRRGQQIIQEAVAAGVIAVEAAEPDAVMAVQPYQRDRRRYLLWRLLGTRLLMGRVPTYRGFGLIRLAAAEPRAAWRELKGTVARIRDRQRREVRS